MAELQGAYAQILIMFFIVAVGYIVAKLGYVSKAGLSSINKLLIHLALPCMIIASVSSLDPSTGARQVPWFFVMAFAQFVLLVLVAWGLNRLLRVPSWQQPIYLFSNGVCTNTGFFCLPIIAAVYGDSTILGSSIYVLMCNLFIGTLGMAILESGDPTLRKPENGGPQGLHLRFHVRMLWNAPLVGCVFALVLFFTGWRLPGVVDGTISSIGAVCTPLAMLMVGVALGQAGARGALSDWRMYVFTTVRQLVVPAAFYLLLSQLIADATMVAIFVIMLSAPVGAVMPAWVDAYHQDGSFAAQLTVVSTVLGFVFIPLLVTLMSLG